MDTGLSKDVSLRARLRKQPGGSTSASRPVKGSSSPMTPVASRKPRGGAGKRRGIDRMDPKPVGLSSAKRAVGTGDSTAGVHFPQESGLAEFNCVVVEPPTDLSGTTICMTLRINGKLFRFKTKGPASADTVAGIAERTALISFFGTKLGVSSYRSIQLLQNGDVVFNQVSLQKGGAVQRQLACSTQQSGAVEAARRLRLAANGAVTIATEPRDVDVKPGANLLAKVSVVAKSQRLNCLREINRLATQASALSSNDKSGDDQVASSLEPVSFSSPSRGPRGDGTQMGEAAGSSKSGAGVSIGDSAEELAAFLKANSKAGTTPTVVEPLVDLQDQRGQTCKLYGTSVAMWQRYNAKRAAGEAVDMPPMARKGDARAKGLPAETSLRTVAKKEFGSSVGEVYTARALTGLAKHFGFAGTEVLEPSADDYIATLQGVVESNRPAVVFFEVDVDNGQPISAGGTWEHAAVVCGSFYDKKGDLKFVVAQWGEFYVHDASSLRDSANQLKKVRKPERFVKLPDHGWKEFEALKAFHGVDATAIPKSVKAKLKMRKASKPKSGLRNKILVVDY